jgi:hypothetical protein
MGIIMKIIQIFYEVQIKNKKHKSEKIIINCIKKVIKIAYYLYFKS